MVSSDTIPEAELWTDARLLVMAGPLQLKDPGVTRFARQFKTALPPLAKRSSGRFGVSRRGSLVPIECIHVV